MHVCQTSTFITSHSFIILSVTQFHQHHCKSPPRRPERYIMSSPILRYPTLTSYSPKGDDHRMAYCAWEQPRDPASAELMNKPETPMKVCRMKENVLHSYSGLHSNIPTPRTLTFCVTKHKTSHNTKAGCFYLHTTNKECKRCDLRIHPC